MNTRQKRIMTIAYNTPGWTAFGADHETVNCVCGLVNCGLLAMNETKDSISITSFGIEQAHQYYGK